MTLQGNDCRNVLRDDALLCRVAASMVATVEGRLHGVYGVLSEHIGSVLASPTACLLYGRADTQNHWLAEAVILIAGTVHAR